MKGDFTQTSLSDIVCYKKIHFHVTHHRKTLQVTQSRAGGSSSTASSPPPSKQNCTEGQKVHLKLVCSCYMSVQLSDSLLWPPRTTTWQLTKMNTFHILWFNKSNFHKLVAKKPFRLTWVWRWKDNGVSPPGRRQCDAASAAIDSPHTEETCATSGTSGMSPW